MNQPLRGSPLLHTPSPSNSSILVLVQYYTFSVLFSGPWVPRTPPYRGFLSVRHIHFGCDVMMWLRDVWKSFKNQWKMWHEMEKATAMWFQIRVIIGDITGSVRNGMPRPRNGSNTCKALQMTCALITYTLVRIVSLSYLSMMRGRWYATAVAWTW